MKETMIFYKDWHEAIKGYEPEERLQAYEAIFAYAFEGVEPSDKFIKAVTALMCAAIDRDNNKYEEKCERNRRNAAARWQSGRMRSHQSHAVDAYNDNDNDNGNGNDNDNEPTTNVAGDNKEKPSKEGKKKVAPVTRFVKPTIEQVAAYCSERGNYVDAANFVDFYEAKGWRVGNSPMKDWKAAVRTWEQRDGRPRRAAQGGATLGVGEYIEPGTGRRTFGSGRVTIPPDAPARPSARHSWNCVTKEWILL